MPKVGGPPRNFPCSHPSVRDDTWNPAQKTIDVRWLRWPSCGNPQKETMNNPFLWEFFMKKLNLSTLNPYGFKHFLRRYLTPQIIPQTLPKKVLGSIGNISIYHIRCNYPNITYQHEFRDVSWALMGIYMIYQGNSIHQPCPFGFVWMNHSSPLGSSSEGPLLEAARLLNIPEN